MMTERNEAGGRARGWMVVAIGFVLIACTTPRGVSTLVPVGPGKGFRAPGPLVLLVTFEDVKGCPKEAKPEGPGNACPNQRPNCGLASRTQKVTFKEKNQKRPFSVYFDPSQPAIRVDGNTTPIPWQADITVHPTAPYIEYKFSIISDACPGQFFDPTVIVEN